MRMTALTFPIALALVAAAPLAAQTRPDPAALLTAQREAMAAGAVTRRWHSCRLAAGLARSATAETNRPGTATVGTRHAPIPADSGRRADASRR